MVPMSYVKLLKIRSFKKTKIAITLSKYTHFRQFTYILKRFIRFGSENIRKLNFESTIYFKTFRQQSLSLTARMTRLCVIYMLKHGSVHNSPHNEPESSIKCPKRVVVLIYLSFDRTHSLKTKLWITYLRPPLLLMLTFWQPDDSKSVHVNINGTDELRKVIKNTIIQEN